MVPYLLTSRQYKARLVKQGHGVPVPLVSSAIILLNVGELASEEDNAFIRWVHMVRCLSSMVALRVTINKADVRLERKLRYDFTKLRAKGQVRAMFCSYYVRLCR